MDEKDPIRRFLEWFEEAKRREPDVPNAMALATADADGAPSVRMVLLKDVDQRGFVFYTQSTMVNAARHTARAMSVQNMTIDQARAIATSELSALPFEVGANGFVITPTDCIVVAAGQQDARVIITIPIARAAFINFSGLFGDGNLTADVRMRKEQVCA